MQHLSPQIRAALFKAASGSDWVGRIQAISRHEECVPFIADNVKYIIAFVSPSPALAATGEIDWRFRDKDGELYLPKLQHRVIALLADCEHPANGMSEICNASAQHVEQGRHGNFDKLFTRAFKTYWYTNTAVDQYFFASTLPIADYLNNSDIADYRSAEAEAELHLIGELAPPYVGFEVCRTSDRQLTYLDRIRSFSIHIDVEPVGTPNHLYANGNQQVTIRIDIRKTREHADGTVENMPLTAVEIYSLRIRERGSPADSPMPPGWSVSRTRDERFDQGVRVTSHAHQQEQYRQRFDEGLAPSSEEGIESLYLYVTTTEVVVRAFVAEITLTGIGTVSTAGENWGIPATQVLIQPTQPRQLQLSDFDIYQDELLNANVSGQEGNWRWLRMTHFRLKPDSVQMESLDITDVPYYGTAAYRTFARGDTQIAAVVAGKTTSVITTLIRQGYVSYPSLYPQYWLFPATDISAFIYTDTDFNLAHFSTTSVIRLRDKVGTLSNFYLHLGADNFPVLSTTA